MRNITDTTLDRPSRKLDKRIVGIVIAFIGAACLILASFSKSWMANDNFSGLTRDRDGKVTASGGRFMGLRGDIRFGPLGFEHCYKPGSARFEFDETPKATTCKTYSTAEFNELIGTLAPMDKDKLTSGAFAKAGWIAFFTCLLAAAGLLASATLALLKKQKELPVSPASVALVGIMLAMASGCVFIATKPGPPGMLGVELGFWTFGIGTVLGIVAAQMLAKELRPPDPDLLAGAMNPDDFSAFPTSFAQPGSQPVQMPQDAMVPVPVTLPATATTDSPVESPAESPGDPGKRDELSS